MRCIRQALILVEGGSEFFIHLSIERGVDSKQMEGV